MNRSGKLFAIISLILCLAMLFVACTTPDDQDNGNGGADTETGDNNENGNNNENNGNDGNNDNENNNGDDNTDDGKVTYTVNVADLDGNPVAGVEVQFCVGEICNAPVLSDANGVASVTVTPDNYHVKINPGVYAADPAEYEFEEGSTTLNVTVYKLPTGSADEPIPVTDTTTQIKLKANAKLYYSIFAPGGKILTIKSEKAVVEYNGTTYTAEDGKVEIALADAMVATVAVSASDGKLTIFNMTIESAPGTMNNPLTLETLDPTTVSVAANSDVYYVWTATMNGTLTVSCANTLNDISLANVTSSIYSDPSDGAASVSLSVNKGDTVHIVVSTVIDEATWTKPAAELDISFILLAE